MFDRLMELPLFRGVGRDAMERTVGAAKFHFLKYMPGEVIIRAGQPCTDLAFIISGTVRINIDNADERFSISSSLAAPDAIAPDFLLGKVTNYPCTVVAQDTVSMLLIPKADFINLLMNEKVFLFNYLNFLSMNAQKSVEGILAVSTGSLAERITFWISALTQQRSYDIHLDCRRADLSSLFGVTRNQIAATLEVMREDGLIEYTPTRIIVPIRSILLDILYNHAE